jgi:hypothetical protein
MPTASKHSVTPRLEHAHEQRDAARLDHRHLKFIILTIGVSELVIDAYQCLHAPRPLRGLARTEPHHRARHLAQGHRIEAPTATVVATNRMRIWRSTAAATAAVTIARRRRRRRRRRLALACRRRNRRRAG